MHAELWGVRMSRENNLSVLLELEWKEGEKKKKLNIDQSSCCGSRTMNERMPK